MQSILDKMRVANDSEVRYFLRGEEEELAMHDLVGQTIHLQFGGKITCMNCGKQIRKSFQGFCYPCFTNAPQAAECIIRPELCEAHLGKGRDVEWEEAHHNQPHFVYLALSGDVKVGVTRSTQIPTRWIDQGATAAIVFAETPYRQLAGQIELELKQFITDKTDWRKMLRNEIADINLLDQKSMLAELLSKSLVEYVNTDNTVFQFNYPVIAYPKKVSGIRLDTQPEIENKLAGIKGQYLIFDTGKALNIRNHSGYHVLIEY